MILIEPTIQAKYGRSLRQRALSAFLKEAAGAVELNGDVSVLVTSDEEIRRLNRIYRGKNKATDVLSFPAAEPLNGHPGMAGDLAISAETAARQAEELGHPLATELQILVLHGLLHLAGYDHEIDQGQMARREAALRRRLGLRAGLIERAGQAAGPGTAPARRRRRP